MESGDVVDAVDAAVVGVKHDDVEVTFASVCVLLFLSIGGGVVCFRLVPAVRDLFIKANLYGKDLNKKDKPQIPESLGVVCGTVYLVVLFLFIPFHFHSSLLDTLDRDTFPYDKLVAFVSALLSICCMIFLGFADDVLNLAWRHKLWLPTVASLPLLVVYFVNDGSTWVLVPPFVQEWIGGESVHLGLFFYVYIGMLAVFCTNAINIMAGINGVEVGQSLIIAVSLLILSVVLYFQGNDDRHDYYLSISLLLPFCVVSAVLFHFNAFPARVFVGDTYCYFAGMTFAVVGILGHLSRTMLLFLAPQVFNFVLSVPQLFRLVPCPRHRMPKFNASTGLLENSEIAIERKSISSLANAIISVLGAFHVVKVTKEKDIVTVSNFTILNTLLHMIGPMSERQLANTVFYIQIFFSVVALAIRIAFV
eukprot:m.41453 g.41453  ORF g.41453 m.41453 type:complete len:421 (-) comp10426_c0_seq1:20-1282(-)